MSATQACLREEHRLRYPQLRIKQWYDVVPIFPGVTTRRTDILGDRLTRIATPRGFETLRAEHFRYRERPPGSEEAYAELKQPVLA